jgi:hypothetical protein
MALQAGTMLARSRASGMVALECGRDSLDLNL